MERTPLALVSSFCINIIEILKSFLSSFRTETVVINRKRLKVVKKLGEGGFSYVYLVTDPQLGTQYALKRIKIQLKEQEIMLKREIAAHQQVNDSVYVVKLVDSSIIYAGSSAVEGLLLLPFYPGGTVQDLIDKHQKIPLKRILSITADICRGLIAFHTKNLSFRDLKPANCLIDGAGRAVLMDLGSVSTARLAINSRKEALALQELCAESCTAPFRAPELFDPPSDSVINETCDIWSLGCTVYALGYGESPFDGSATAAIGGRILFPTASDTYGTRFRDFIQGMLVVDHKIRPTAQQMLHQAELYLNSLESGNV